MEKIRWWATMTTRLGAYDCIRGETPPGRRFVHREVVRPQTRRARRVNFFPEPQRSKRYWREEQHQRAFQDKVGVSPPSITGIVVEPSVPESTGFHMTRNSSP